MTGTGQISQYRPYSSLRHLALAGLLLFQAQTTAMPQSEILLTLSNPSSFSRRGEPVTCGVPLVKGFTADATALVLRGPDGSPVPLQTLVSGTYSDGTPRWVLLDFRAHLPAGEKTVFRLGADGKPDGGADVETAPSPARLSYELTDGIARVDTGAALFRIDTRRFHLWDSVRIGGVELIGKHDATTGAILEDSEGKRFRADTAVTEAAFEDGGSLRVVLRLRGRIGPVNAGARRRLPLTDYTCRMHFYAGLAEVRVFFTLHNPAAQMHPGNIWELGSGGSVYMEDFSLVLPLAGGQAWETRISEDESTYTRENLELYQDSSGGPNWRSVNHIDKDYKIPVTFRGYRVVRGEEQVATGNRADGWLHARSQAGGVGVSVREFWQNFPKALEFTDNRIRVALWPREFAGVHELLGGEQKTHEMLFVFHGPPPSTRRADDRADGPETADRSDERIPRRLTAFQRPIYAMPDPRSVLVSGTFLPTAPLDRGRHPKLEATCDTAVYPRGGRPDTIITQWETIDEFGWRHFGDTFADNERAPPEMVRDFPEHHLGSQPISHYVNEYDVIYAVVLQGLRRSDPEWMRLADVLSRHHADICIYHTDVGSASYRHGPFMHTTHATAAYRSTFRSYPIEAKKYDLRYGRGGGPNAGHTYVASLAQHYWLTGDRVSRDAFLEVAGWAADSPWLRKEGMGDQRGYGNFLMTFVYAYQLTGDRMYYDRAMTLVSWIDAPFDGLGGTLFSKAAGRFLQMKIEGGELDVDYRTVRDLLLEFGDLYLTLPSSRWSRWLEQRCFHSEVLCTAYLYAPKDHPRREEYYRKGRQILDEALDRFPGHYVGTKTWVMCFANTGAYLRAGEIEQEETQERVSGEKKGGSR